MVTSCIRGELVEIIKYEDRKEEVLGVKFKDPRVNWGMRVKGVVAVAYFEKRFFKRYCN